jgi:alkylhydroperoxidase family enzyme
MRLENKIIEWFERQLGHDLGYIRELLASSRAAFWKFGLFNWIADHGRHTPVQLRHLARLGATHGEDCGPCTQIVVTLAQRDGVPRQILAAALAGGHGLPPLERDVYRFGRAVSVGGADIDALRERLEADLGRAAVVELVYAISMARVYPALKRGLGYGQSCAVVKIAV